MLSDISPLLLHTLYLVAIVAEAMTAALSAGRRDMDWMGVCIIACVTALGGGGERPGPAPGGPRGSGCRAIGR